MPDQFDPYYRWLAIPPAEQPVNHYRLLGLNLFESNSDVIDTAAHARMMHLRSLQLSQHVEMQQKLMTEVAAARLCLLKPEKKAAYDAELKAKIAGKRATQPPGQILVAKLVSPGSAGAAAAGSAKPIAAQPVGPKPVVAKPITAQPITAKPLTAQPIQPQATDATPAKPAPAKSSGRRMLPPPKPVAEVPSDSETGDTPGSEFDFLKDDATKASEPTASAAVEDPTFEVGDDGPGDAELFSSLSDITTAAGEPALSAGSAIGGAIGRSKTRRSNSNQKWVWITAGGIAAVAAVLIAAAVINGNNPASSLPPPPPRTGHLVFDWPEDERIATKLTIDGKTTTVPSSGAVDFELPAGAHRINLRRLGNEPIERTVDLKPDERYQFQPSWQPLVPLAGAGNAASISQDNDMLVAEALPELKRWSTDFAAAKQDATRQSKDIFVVFFGPDNRQWCLQLATDLLTNPKFRQFVDPRFELVLLEEPVAAPQSAPDSGGAHSDDAHSDGKGRLAAAEIAHLAANFGVTSFPTIVLTDADGLPFDREEYKQVSLVDYLQSFAAAMQVRKERDKFFAPTKTGSDADRVAAAEKALEWLEKNGLASLYVPQIRHWLAMAEKIDPNNEHGRCEEFFLAEVREKLKLAGKDDAQKILAASKPLEDWQKAGKKYKDGDLAAHDYLEVAALLFNAGDPQNAAAFIEGAYNCNPSDPRLKSYLSQLHDMITSPESFGSGFVFADGGYVLTNNHVIAGDGQIFVRVPGTKKEIPADVVSASAELDVAVIKMHGDIPPIKPLRLATATLGRGTEVVAFGYPLGQDDIKLTQGPISAPPSDKDRFYVLDLRVNPGNSGGPLVDMKGEVVGIVSAKTIARTEMVDSYGLAIPGRVAAAFVKQLSPTISGYQSLGADESAKLPEQDKLTKVDAMVSPAVVQIVKRRG